MLKRCIIAENRKLHASPIWVIFFVLPLISAGYGTFNYLQNLEILTERWYSLWTQHTLFYSMLFFPAMVSAYAAYLWRLEHLGHNWNLIMAAPVRPFALFAAKLLVVVKLMCFTQCFVFVLYVACGRLFAGFSDWPPMSIVFYLVRGIFGGLAVAAVQLLLAMLIRSFAVPIFLGLVGGIAGMLIGNKGYALLWPYCLMQQGMNANRSTDVLAGNVLPFLLACAGWLAARRYMAGGHLRESTEPGMPSLYLLALYFCLRNALPCCIIKALTNRRARHDCQCCRFCRVRVRAPL